MMWREEEEKWMTPVERCMDDLRKIIQPERIKAFPPISHWRHGKYQCWRHAANLIFYNSLITVVNRFIIHGVAHQTGQPVTLGVNCGSNRR